jgi:hypothetical protein
VRRVTGCTTPEERLLAQTIKVPLTPCWFWTGRSSHGYGEFMHQGSKYRAHRVSYEMHVGAIPQGLVLDHLCETPCCVNPWHLEPVTRVENVKRHYRRQTHCKRGHPLSGDNLRVKRRGNGVRECKTCGNALRSLTRRAERIVNGHAVEAN